jgi:hypothetical protein
MLRLATSLFMVVLSASCVSNPIEPKKPSELHSLGEADAAPDDGWQVVRAKLAREARDDFLRSDYYKGPIAERQAAREAGAFATELAKELPPASQEITPPDFSAIPREGQCVACNILFDVTPGGVPVNILAMCTAPELNQIAHEAIAQARFAARIRRAKAVKRLNVVYPIETGICE